MSLPAQRRCPPAGPPADGGKRGGDEVGWFVRRVGTGRAGEERDASAPRAASASRRASSRRFPRCPRWRGVSEPGCAAPRRRQRARRRGRNVRRAAGIFPPRHRRLFREGHERLPVGARPRARRRPRRSAATGPPPGARDTTAHALSTRGGARPTARDALAVASVADIRSDTHARPTVPRQCRYLFVPRPAATLRRTLSHAHPTSARLRTRTPWATR